MSVREQCRFGSGGALGIMFGFRCHKSVGRRDSTYLICMVRIVERASEDVGGAGQDAGGAVSSES
jgi:hypothetical protein